MRADSVLLAGGLPAATALVRDHNGRNSASDLFDAQMDVKALQSVRSARRRSPAPQAPGAVAENVLRSFNTWHFKREQPSDPRLMLGIIAEAVAADLPVPFVTYWGKGPRCTRAEPDIQCLDFLDELAARVRAVYRPGAALTLIFTDTHAQLNGHAPATIGRYMADVEASARERGFDGCRLSGLVRAAGPMPLDDDEAPPDDLLARLCASAEKWYRGEERPEQGARAYYRMNMVERRAVELAFPRSIFVTFNGSDLRGLFPKRLPIFYMYSLRRGFGVKPWFLPAGAPACDEHACRCAAVQG